MILGLIQRAHLKDSCGKTSDEFEPHGDIEHQSYTQRNQMHMRNMAGNLAHTHVHWSCLSIAATVHTKAPQC